MVLRKAQADSVGRDVLDPARGKAVVAVLNDGHRMRRASQGPGIAKARNALLIFIECSENEDTFAAHVGSAHVAARLKKTVDWNERRDFAR